MNDDEFEQLITESLDRAERSDASFRHRYQVEEFGLYIGLFQLKTQNLMRIGGIIDYTPTTRDYDEVKGLSSPA